MLVILLKARNPAPRINNPIRTMRRGPSLSIKYPETGPMIEPSTLLKENARDSWDRLQWNLCSSTTNQAGIPWNMGTVPITMTRAATPANHQP